MKRVIQVSEPFTTGVPVHVAALARGLREWGWESTIVCSARGSLQALKHDGFAVVTLPLERGLRPLADARVFPRLVRALARSDADIVHVHSTKAGILGRPAAKLLRLPVVYTPHAAHFMAYPVGAWRRGVSRLGEQLLRPLTDAHIAVSSSEGQILTRERVARAERLRVIPNAVPFGQAAHAVGRPTFREREGIAPGQRLVVNVSRLYPQKDPACFVRAAALVKAALGNVTFVFVGDGPLAGEMATLAATLDLGDTLRFLGWRDDVPDILASADAYVLTSTFEGLPLTVLEAMHSRVPVIATQAPGTDALIRDGQTGYLAPIGDHRRLAQQIIRVLSGDPGLNQIVTAAYEYVTQQHDIGTMARSTADLYEQLARRGAPATSRAASGAGRQGVRQDLRGAAP